jgi:hypothetical protein
LSEIAFREAKLFVFIFQSVPERYDLRKAIIPGSSDTWYATRYKDKMAVGSVVFFWMAGDEGIRGIYGWGHIKSLPYIKPEWDGHGVDVVYDVRFTIPILANSFRKDPRFSQMLIFRVPQATNFLLSTDEARDLTGLIGERGERAPDFRP